MSDPEPNTPPPTVAPVQPVPPPHRKPWKLIIGCILLVIVLIAAVPWVLKLLSTVSTDDAYVNGHVTFVAPRVAGQVARVLVDDNNRVHKGDLLVQLDPEPFRGSGKHRPVCGRCCPGGSGGCAGPGPWHGGSSSQSAIRSRALHRGCGQPDRLAALQGCRVEIAESRPGQSSSRSLIAQRPWSLPAL